MKRIVMILLLLCMTACDSTANTAGERDGTPTVTIPTAAPTRPLEETALDTVTDGNAGEQDDPRFDLNLWLTSDIGINSEAPEATLLAFQLSEFDTTHPDVRLDITEKAVTGQGGTLSYLRSGRNVAPDILPDVVVLPTSQLATAASEGLIYPLDEFIATDGLYEAAAELGRINDTLYGVPFIFDDLYHVAYNSSSLDEPFPRQWSDFSELEDAKLLLAAAGGDGAAFALQAYASAGGSLADGEQFQFESDELTQAMGLLRTGVASEVLLPLSATLTTSAETWNLFRRGDANVAVVQATDFLAEQTDGTAIRYAPIPGVNDSMQPVVGGWAWAIATPDTARQAISAELIAWLVNSQNLGTWSAAAGKLPARPSAFAEWPTDPYITFLQNSLRMAQAFPNRLGSAGTSALNNAVVSIINQPITAEDAANQVIQTLAP